MIKGEYGKELILDLHNCNPNLFIRKNIRNYFKEVCDIIDMKRCALYWWDDYGVPLEDQQTEPHLKGTTAIQFILTSNITIHTLDLLRNVYINVFSCKDFDSDIVIDFTKNYFHGKIVSIHILERK